MLSFLALVLCVVTALCDCDKPTNSSQMTNAPCQDSLFKSQQWIFPALGTAGKIKLKADPALCFDYECDQQPCLKNGVYGPDAYAMSCTDTSPTFSINSNKTITVTSEGPVKGYCMDLRAGHFMQLYPCVGSLNQQWSIDSESRLVAADRTCIGACSMAPTPPPVPPFCARYHPIHDPGVYDPSGPLLDERGVWHTWEDRGAWSHWTSKDLIHWNGSFTKGTTDFGGDTGSVSPTSSGVYAFWPIMGGPGKGAIGSAVAADEGLTTWTHRGPTIPMPTRINTGYRDPVRAFEYNGKWYVGVGCGSKAEGAQFCLFEASDDTLLNFTDRGSLYTTNVTYGYVDGNIVWQPTNVSANMMECPDLFPLGDKWVLIGSLYKTNQWWVGTLSGNPPRFTPENVGILDYGNGYAAKTGSTWVQSGQTRRLVFGFTGWQEPTMPSGCGRALIIPRELHVDDATSTLMTSPIKELEVLREPASHLYHSGLTSSSAVTLAKGSQVEVQLTCTGITSGTKGKVGVRTLATTDGEAYTEIGYDFDAQAMYADHSHCCAKPNTIVQRAPFSVRGATIEMAIYVDGGLIEAFMGGRVITPLVAPDINAGAPEDRHTTLVVPAGVQCDASSWKLTY